MSISLQQNRFATASAVCFRERWPASPPWANAIIRISRSWRLGGIHAFPSMAKISWAPSGLVGSRHWPPYLKKIPRSSNFPWKSVFHFSKPNSSINTFLNKRWAIIICFAEGTVPLSHAPISNLCRFSSAFGANSFSTAKRMRRAFSFRSVGNFGISYTRWAPLLRKSVKQFSIPGVCRNSVRKVANSAQNLLKRARHCLVAVTPSPLSPFSRNKRFRWSVWIITGSSSVPVESKLLFNKKDWTKP